MSETRVPLPWVIFVAVVMVTTACGQDSDTTVGSERPAGSIPAAEQRGPAIELPVPNMRELHDPPTLALSADRVLIMTRPPGSGAPQAAGIRLADGTFQSIGPLPSLETFTAVGLTNGFAITGSQCLEPTDFDCGLFSNVAFFLDREGKISAEHDLGTSLDPPHPQAVGDAILVEMNDKPTVLGPDGASPVDPPDGVRQTCAVWPAEVIALEQEVEELSRPEDTLREVRLFERRGDAWTVISDTELKDLSGTGLYALCVTGAIHVGSRFYTGTTDRWISMPDVVLDPDSEVLGMTSKSDVVLAGRDGTRLISPDGSERELAPPPPLSSAPPLTVNNTSVAFRSDGSALAIVIVDPSRPAEVELVDG
jgi:hypothetical protein